MLCACPPDIRGRHQQQQTNSDKGAALGIPFKNVQCSDVERLSDHVDGELHVLRNRASAEPSDGAEQEGRVETRTGTGGYLHAQPAWF